MRKETKEAKKEREAAALKAETKALREHLIARQQTAYAHRAPDRSSHSLRKMPTSPDLDSAARDSFRDG